MLSVAEVPVCNAYYSANVSEPFSFIRKKRGGGGGREREKSEMGRKMCGAGDDFPSSPSLLIISLSPVPLIFVSARHPRSSLFHSPYLSPLKRERGLCGGESEWTGM